ncbi:MAG TPA: SH3 domain-containing protein [Aggregatilineales bacterium]|nr:SH3 domain-containing protein [Aggregatilineales bacterium]
MKHQKVRIFALCAVIISLIFMAAFVSDLNGPRAALAQATGCGNWQGFYWNNGSFSGNPTSTRTDPSIGFNWGTSSPAPNINGGGPFTVRWYSTIGFGNGGIYDFHAGAKDGIRIAVDGNLVMNHWQTQSSFTVYDQNVNLTAGNHQIIVDFGDFGTNDAAGVLFNWTTVSGDSTVTCTAATPTPGPTPTGPAVPSSTGLQVTNIKAVVITALANVRSGPSTSFTPVTQITRGTVVGVVAQNGVNTWFMVQLKDGTRGWIFRRMIYLYGGDITKLPFTTVAFQPLPSLANVQGESRIPAMVRSGPSTRGDKLGVIPQGEDFQILKLSRNRAWVYVNDQGLQGWVFIVNVKIIFGDLGMVPVSN